MPRSGLIVGLGNPGPQYTHTRHNLGFLVLESLLAQWRASGADIRPKRFPGIQGELWDVFEYGKSWLLLKPLTFMNLSGQAVAPVLRKNGLAVEQLLVLHDELDLPFSTLRLKFAGGLAGHNGLKSVATSLGSRDFARLRLGIGRPQPGLSVVDYVLRTFPPEEKNALPFLLTDAAEAVRTYCSSGLTAAMHTLHSSSVR